MSANAFHKGNTEISGPLAIADTFNKYFVDVGPNLAKYQFLLNHSKNVKTKV